MVVAHRGQNSDGYVEDKKWQEKDSSRLQSNILPRATALNKCSSAIRHVVIPERSVRVV